MKCISPYLTSKDCLRMNPLHEPHCRVSSAWQWGYLAIWLSGPGRLHTDTRLLQGFLHWIANQLPWKQQEVKSLVVGTNDSAEACHLVGTKTLKLDGVPYCTLFFFGVPSCPCSLAPCCRNHRKSQKHPIVRPIAMVLV